MGCCVALEAFCFLRAERAGSAACCWPPFLAGTCECMDARMCKRVHMLVFMHGAVRHRRVQVSCLHVLYTLLTCPCININLLLKAWTCKPGLIFVPGLMYEDQPFFSTGST